MSIHCSSAFKVLPSIQLAARVGLAAGLSLVIARAVELKSPLYSMIAAVIVCELSPEGTRALTLERLIGTVIGAAIGGALSSTLPHGALWTGAAVGVSYLACELIGFHSAAKLAGFLCGIIMIEHASSPWAYTLDRSVETVVGVAVALMVSLVPRLAPEVSGVGTPPGSVPHS